MGQFDALLTELDELAELRKSRQAADEALLKAEAKSDDDKDEDDAHEEPDGDEADDEDEDEMFGKSMTVGLPDGTQVRAFDGTEVISALRDEMAGTRDQTLQALTGALDLIKSMSADIAALNSEVARLGQQRQPRKTVLNVHEKPDVLATSGAQETPRVAPQAILAKALQAQREGRLHGPQVAEIEGYLSHGYELPQHLSALLA